MKYNPHDKYFEQAKQQGYRARSVFKLKEIQDKFRLIKSGNKVLDLGAAPGSFMQLIKKLVGDNGLVIGVDLQSIKPFKKNNIKCYEGDIFDEKIYQKIEKDTGVSQFDVITSDLAPATTGIKAVDAGRSFQLNEQVLSVAEKYLKPGGSVILKTFPGADQDNLIAITKKLFKKFRIFKPKAVRKSSREVYVVGSQKISDF